MEHQGEWMAWALKRYTEAHKPGDAHYNDTVGYHTYILMDDGVLVEPRLGIRPWAASATFEKGLRILLGREALKTSTNWLRKGSSTRRPSSGD